MKIRHRKRLDITDFMKAIKNLPSAFVPSVFYQQWVKEGKVRPSDVLKAQIDLRTMTWKDMLPVIEVTEEMRRNKNTPEIRPMPNQYGCEINLNGATGIPLPK